MKDRLQIALEESRAREKEALEWAKSLRIENDTQRDRLQELTNREELVNARLRSSTTNALPGDYTNQLLEQLEQVHLGKLAAEDRVSELELAAMKEHHHSCESESESDSENDGITIICNKTQLANKQCIVSKLGYIHILHILHPRLLGYSSKSIVISRT